LKSFQRERLSKKALAVDAAEPVHLRFTFWGSAFEKKDITAHRGV